MRGADELIGPARRGDAAAVEEFVRVTMPDVWRFLAHLVDVGSADDLTQETYERAFGALRAFRGDSSARTWLLAIARRVAVDELRRRGRRGGTAAGALGPMPGADPDRDDVPAPGDLAEQVAVRDLVQRLDVERREAFVLTQVLGLEYAEAARLCGCPIGTIRSRVARARDDLIKTAADGVRGARASRLA